MSLTSDHKLVRSRGLTLVEVMVAVTLAAFVFAAILSAFIFMGRNLTRLLNRQSQDAASRRAVSQFTRDLSAAMQLTTCTATQVTLTRPTAGGTVTTSYAYTPAAGKFVRTEGSSSWPLLSGLTALSITYYNESGAVITNSPLSVKAVELSFTLVTGSAPNGTQVKSTTVAPRVLLRNKPLLQ